jgi:hypothetical protein
MEVATIRLRLNKVGSDIPLTNVTPAEAMMLHVLHQGNNGGSTFGEDMDKIKVTGESELTDAQEYNRLFAKYGRCVTKKGVTIISLLFPNRFSLNFPKKFSEIPWSELTFDGNDIAALDLSSGLPVNK